VKRFFLALLVSLLAVATVSAQTQNFHVLHEFNGAADGANPEGKLLRDAAGSLYGTTFAGGPDGEGTVFKIDSAGTETVLFSFDALVSGSNPASGLILDQAGNLYGTADEGPGGAGVVFKISPDGQETLLFAFQGGLNRNPRVPSGGLLMDKAGNLYGTTIFGGNGNCQFGCGVIYRLDPAGQLRVLHAFSGGADGRRPLGALAPDANGNLYGVAQSGGDLTCAGRFEAGCGTVFRVSRTGKLTVLHTFHGGSDGAAPPGDLLVDTVGGNLYGATSSGGASFGTLFRISRNGTYAILHRFSGGDDGATPNGSLVLDEAGNLFGTAQTGGRGGDGTAFALSPAGQLTILHTFEADLDGAFPLGGLIRDETGHLFGVAVSNGLVQQRNGDVFEIRP